MEVVTRWWLAFAGDAGGFLDEAAFRVSLASAVLWGRLPLQAEKRWWNRSTETPALLDVYSYDDLVLATALACWRARHKGSALRLLNAQQAARLGFF